MIYVLLGAGMVLGIATAAGIVLFAAVPLGKVFEKWVRFWEEK